MDYFLADPHFGHENIVLYCGRPFQNIKHMDDTIIANWRRVVAPEDTVYLLGDFALTNTEGVTRYINALTGKIILVAGNHDMSRTTTFWRKRGVEAYKVPIDYNGGEFVLSHEPIMFPIIPNVHGHTHGNVHRGSVASHGVHICVSADVVDFTPVSVTHIRERIAAIYEEERNDRTESEHHESREGTR